MSAVSTPARRPTTSCSGRSPRPARRSAAAIRAGPARARACGTAREADPRRRRARRWLVGRRRGARWRARGVGRRARRGRPITPSPPGSARTCRSSSRVARPWSKVAARPSRRSMACTARPASSWSPGHRRLRRPTCSPPSTPSATRATARSACRPPTLPRSCGRAWRRGPRRARGRPRVGERSAPGDRARRPGSRPVQARAQPHPRTADRAVRLRARRSGRSILPRRRRRPPPTPSEPPCATGTLTAPGRPNRSSPPRPSWATPRKGTVMTRRAVSTTGAPAPSALQPGHRQRRPPVLLRTGRPGPGDRAPCRGWHRARDRAGDGQPDRRP